MEGLVDVPGLSSVPPSHMLVCLVDNTVKNYDWFEYHGRRCLETKGIIMNSIELEGSSCRYRRCPPRSGDPRHRSSDLVR
uniref:Uncharacterized protein n=1 Tax=Oryza brachyantha TaxID=4533 RepID=J3M5G6_ORYBR